MFLISRAVAIQTSRRCADNLSGLPPALVITAGCDVLRDEGEAYAQRLSEAGVSVQRTRYEGMIHGFLRRYALFDQGKAALEEIAAALKNALAIDRDSSKTTNS